MGLTIKKVLRQKTPGKFLDERGLYLQVINANNRSWIFRYKIDGLTHWMGLGSVKDYGLEEARERARLARQQIKDGVDPLVVRRKQVAANKLAACNIKTFKECVTGYYAAQSAQWTLKRRKAFTALFATYVYPECGNLPVADIGSTLVLRCVKPIWLTKHPTAIRLRGLIEEVLSWATALGYRAGENPARWAGNLEHLLPRVERDTTNHAALPFAEIPAFMKALRAREGIPARCLEFTVLTACRTKEAIGARWAEINFETKTWIIPASRMKTGIEHNVPLSARAISILQSLPRLNERCFPLSAKGMVRLLHRMDHKELTVHGFRSSFRGWAAELTHYPREVLEMALAHTVKGATEKAYWRTDLFIKRTNLMEDWCVYCASAPAAVLPLRKRDQRAG
jgi:integrase